MADQDNPQLVPAAEAEEDFGCTRVDLGVSDYVEVTPAGDVYCVIGSGEEIAGEMPITRTQITRQPISAYAQTVPAGADGDHGLVLKYRTLTGRLEQRVISSALFHEATNTLPMWLAAHGVNCDPKQLPALRRYFALAQPTIQMVAYDRTGWNMAPDGGAVFVLGEIGVIGGAGTSVFQPGAATSTANVGQRGIIEEWKDNVADPACAVPWWRFAIMAALAAPLLKVLDEGGRGFHVVGKTSQGKTIGAACGASVYGRGSKTDAESFIITWNTTRNGIEGISEAHSDMALVMDELAESDARTVANLIYMITGGVGRTRMRSDTSMQRRKNWRTILLSTGEQTLESKVHEAGQHYSAGMSVRIAEIRADNTGFTKSIEVSVVRNLEAAVQRYYGTAGKLFIERSVADGYGNPGSSVVAALKSRVEQIEADLVGPDDDQRRRRAARSFAIVQAAGELGVAWDILPTAIAPAETCTLAYTIWCGGAGARDTDDTRMAAERLLSLIDECMDGSIIRIDAAASNGDAERTNRERRGWYENGDNTMVVYLLPAALEKALGAYSKKTFLEEGEGLRFLLRGDGNNFQARVPGMGRSYRPRAYKFDYYQLQEFCGGDGVVKPTQVANQTVPGNGVAVDAKSAAAALERRRLASPPCYGNQLDGLSRCLTCPYEADCEQATSAEKSRADKLRYHEDTEADVLAWFDRVHGSGSARLKTTVH